MVSALQAGILAADKVLTVSPNYATEIGSGPDKGVELDRFIRQVGGQDEYGGLLLLQQASMSAVCWGIADSSSSDKDEESLASDQPMQRRQVFIVVCSTCCVTCCVWYGPLLLTLMPSLLHFSSLC